MEGARGHEAAVQAAEMARQGVERPAQRGGAGRPRWSEELVVAPTEDGLLHEGVVIRPTAPAREIAIVLIHGATVGFYARQYLGVGRELAARGLTVISGNTRGHDVGCFTWNRAGERVRGGTAWELFDESPRDVAGWVAFAGDRGFADVVLMGHSFGALKVAYYQSQRDDPRVRGLVLASSPVRSGRLKPAMVALAEELVAAGRGEELLPPGEVGGAALSAQTYLSRARIGLDLYGLDAPSPPIGRVRRPILAFYGTEEPHVGTASDLELIRANAVGAPRVDTAMFEGSDHDYTGHEAAVADRIAAWADGLAGRG